MKLDRYMDILKTWSGKATDLCYVLFQLLDTESGKVQVFQELLEIIGTVESNHTQKLPVHWQDDEYKKFAELYGSFVDKTIVMVRQKGDNEDWILDKYYAALWHEVFESNVLPSTEARAFAFSWIVFDEQIPYMKLDTPLAMPDDEFKEILEDNKEIVREISYIFRTNWDQKTKLSSLVLNAINKSSNMRVKSVLLALAFDTYHKNYCDADSKVKQ